MIKTPAFFIDMQICTGCKTCMVACKDKNDLDPGLRWRRVYEFSGGDWVAGDDGTFTQDVFAYYVSVSCNHCRDPICVEVCPSRAMHKNESGIVLIDSKKCVGCRYCEWACPYSAPQFDFSNGIMTKCDFCQTQIQEDKDPCCVEACPTHALSFGDYDDLVALHGPEPGRCRGAWEPHTGAKQFACIGRLSRPHGVMATFSVFAIFITRPSS